MKLVAEPQNVLNFFYELNQIPRPSYHEEAVVEYIAKFAQDRGLEYFIDDAKNIIVKKAATPGYEDRPVVILQGHTDMVPEKGPNSTHDFLTDPIEMILDGEWLHANDTTLGADNGIAVAMALAVLDSDNVEHGPIECLFTATEETGMDGAIGLDASPLQGKYLLNIDTEVETQFIVSCAGGCSLDVLFPLLKDNHDKAYSSGLKISIAGIQGGHSGIEIHKQRANANQLMARVLYELALKFKYQMASFTGGTKHNAIPNTCVVEIAVRQEDLAGIREFFAQKQADYVAEFTPQDQGLQIIPEDIATPKEVYVPSTTNSLLSYLYLAPHGVIGMSQSLDNLVETSINLAIVKEEPHQIRLTTSLRSSASTPMHYLIERMCLLARVLDAKAEVGGHYPAWEYDAGSPLESKAIEVYTKVFGHAPEVTAIHAGLECGILKNHLPNTQMISFGPNIENAHTPRERVNMASVKRVYDFLLELLKELK